MTRGGTALKVLGNATNAEDVSRLRVVTLPENEVQQPSGTALTDREAETRKKRNHSKVGSCREYGVPSARLYCILNASIETPSSSSSKVEDEV